jgi:hypothetical protein
MAGDFMKYCICTKEAAEAANIQFDLDINELLLAWQNRYKEKMLIEFGQLREQDPAIDALQELFLYEQHPLGQLLENSSVARHLGRNEADVYFDPTSGDPLFSAMEQRVYNLARRIDSERMHVPFRCVHPYKQTEAGDTADINSYPVDSELVRYNSGNHFISRPANSNVFDENSKQCTAKSAGNLTVLFKRGFLEDRLHEIKELTAVAHAAGEKQLQFFVICSRHSLKEGHFGASLVIMDPMKPYFPRRVLVCDTLLKELPQHPRWWNHFVMEYSNVFGNAVAEIIEDISHPLQKVNIKTDEPYLHDWDCPYYVASMTDALSNLVNNDPGLVTNGCDRDIHKAMTSYMPDYYQPDQQIRSRQEIKTTNSSKRWNSGRNMINDLLMEINCDTYHESADL